MNLYNFLHFCNLDALILLNYKGRYLTESPTTPRELLKDEFTKRFNVRNIDSDKWEDKTIMIADII